MKLLPLVWVADREKKLHEAQAGLQQRKAAQ